MGEKKTKVRHTKKNCIDKEFIKIKIMKTSCEI